MGEVAHIAGLRPGSPRYDPNMTDDQRNHYDNLIYLCPTHHTLIDKQAQNYSVEKLREMKRIHEEKVRQAMKEAFAKVAFPELEEATRWVRRIQGASNRVNFQVVLPQDKIQRNELSDDSQWIIRMGLAVAGEVGRYVEAVAREDDQFPERLKSGFLSEYYSLRQKGIFGDELFLGMCEIAGQGLDFPAKMAGVAVLVYLFEKCEVFEQ